MISLTFVPVGADREQDNRAHLLRIREFKTSFIFFLIPKDQPTPDTFSGPSGVILCEHTCVRAGCPVSDYLVHIAEPMCIFFFSMGHFIGTYLDRQSGLPVHSARCLPSCLLTLLKAALG